MALDRDSRPSRAGGVATDSAGNVYVVADRWIEKFDPRGTPLRRWRNTTPPPFNFSPQGVGIATDAAGHVYVSGGHYVTKWTGAGDFVNAWPAQVGNSSGIAVDRSGRVFVADQPRGRINEFTSDGTFLARFGRPGSDNGEFRQPLGLATDARGDLYVADSRNDRVQKFGEPSSAFSLTSVARDSLRGRAQLVANVAGIGGLALAGEGVRNVHRRARGAGDVVLPIVPNGTTWEKLLEEGRARIEANVTYTPTTPPGAAPATKSRLITLILERG